MISFLLLLVLVWGFYIGYRRGLLLQVYYLISAMASAFMAGQFYKGLGEQFHLLLPYANSQEGQGTFFFPSDQLFQLDKVFYAGILSMLVTLFVLQMALTILATIPMAVIQNPLEKSIVAKHIIQSIPITTSWLKQIWVTNLIG